MSSFADLPVAERYDVPCDCDHRGEACLPGCASITGKAGCRVDCCECGEWIGYLDAPDPGQQLYTVCESCSA